MWKEMKIAPKDREIIISCRNWEGDGTAMFFCCWNEFEFDDDEFDPGAWFTPNPDDKRGGWIALMWEPLGWIDIPRRPSTRIDNTTTKIVVRHK